MFKIDSFVKRAKIKMLIHLKREMPIYIKSQHAGGRMIDGTPLPRYNPEYQKYKRNRNPAHYSQHSNLMMSGLLHDTMRADIKGFSVVVSISSIRYYQLLKLNRTWEHWYQNGRPFSTLSMKSTISRWIV